MSTKAKWKNEKTGKVVGGRYRYFPAYDKFVIVLATGRKFETTCECEWGNWKLVEGSDLPL